VVGAAPSPPGKGWLVVVVCRREVVKAMARRGSSNMLSVCVVKLKCCCGWRSLSTVRGRRWGWGWGEGEGLG
jgi:hypothetical protein